MASREHIASVILSLGLLIAGDTGAVVFNGKHWAQPSHFLGFSWDEIALGDQPNTLGDEGGVCPIGGGLCGGAVQGVSFNGWRWATLAEVGELFKAFLPTYPTNNLESTTVNPPLNAPETTAFLGAFAPTFVSPIDSRISAVEAWVAEYEIVSPPCCDFARLAEVIDCEVGSRFCSRDQWSTLRADPPELRRASSGVWLYRVVDVSEPPAFLLLLVGFAHLARRRIQSRGDFPVWSPVIAMCLLQREMISRIST